MTIPADELIPLRPHGAMQMRYGQTPPDSTGKITEVIRIEMDTDRGPFGIEMPVEQYFDFLDRLVTAIEALPAERQAWNRRNSK